MKSSILLVLIMMIVSCQTVKIKNDSYTVSPVATELGSIGQAKSVFNLSNSFDVRTLPRIENKIRLSIEILPFSEPLNKIYVEKGAFNQNQTTITYADSLPQKPEFALIKIIDINGYTNELNADYNKSVFQLLADTKNQKAVSSVALSLSQENIKKIRLADAYYLENKEQSKFSIGLYKQGKRTETLDVTEATILAYQLSSFCWGFSERGKWYIADMPEAQNSCKGATKRNITKKQKSKSLYKM